MDPKRVSELQDDLHAVADDVKADAEELREIEQDKAALPASDDRALPLARRANELATTIAAKTKAELAIAEEAVEATNSEPDRPAPLGRPGR